MMLSRVFGKGSIYETLDLDDRHDDDSQYDPYGSGLTHDEPLGADSRNESYLLQNRGSHSSRISRHHPANSVYRPYENTLPNLNEEEPNDDAPGSLLVEDHYETNGPQAFYGNHEPEEEGIINDMERGLSHQRRGGSRTPDPTVWLGLVAPKERALWKWANVENLDNFLQQVQTYNIFTSSYLGLWVLHRERTLLHLSGAILEFGVLCWHVVADRQDYRICCWVFNVFDRMYKLGKDSWKPLLGGNNHSPWSITVCDTSS
jgi:hypothetical protein